MKKRNEAVAKPARRKTIPAARRRTTFAARRGTIIAAMASAVLVLTAGAFVASRALSARGFEERRYKLTGVVKSVDRAKRRATIQHEKIGDYMEAMTMPFAIKDAKALREMRPGQRIKATLVVTDDGGMWLEGITIDAGS